MERSKSGVSAGAPVADDVGVDVVVVVVLKAGEVGYSTAIGHRQVGHMNERISQSSTQDRWK